MKLSIALLTVLFGLSQATLNLHFAKFIGRHYGPKVMQQLLRSDQSISGSFGGGYAPPNGRRPVVFVHGLGNRAGSLWLQRKQFAENGFAGERLLGTTYGPGEIGAAKINQNMACNHIKQVRNMIIATSRYYKSKVDVIAYSMGSPIARKAIMGGRCVDTHEYIGQPITHHVVTYLSVAGANQGSAWCNIPFPGVCNHLNGMNCNSAFIKDINSKSGYEGKHLYSLATNTDEITGSLTACGKNSYEFKGAHNIVLGGKNHEGMIHGTIGQQINIIKKH